MVNYPGSGFDFDKWCNLAKNDPVEFEEARNSAIKALIQQIPAQRQHRLTGLQWRIDTVRAMAPNSTASFLQISDMMWNSFYKQQEILKSLLEPSSQDNVYPDIQTRTDNVVPFT